MHLIIIIALGIFLGVWLVNFSVILFAKWIDRKEDKERRKRQALADRLLNTAPHKPPAPAAKPVPVALVVVVVCLWSVAVLRALLP